jgi:hypothetical protein
MDPDGSDSSLPGWRFFLLSPLAMPHIVSSFVPRTMPRDEE